MKRQSFMQFIQSWWRRGWVFVESLALKERSPHKLALSCCVGIYISFSPFVFLHTVMVLVFSWLFSLNLPAVFAGAFVNNPWTMMPCYAADYAVGEGVFWCLGIDSAALNPAWMAWVNGPLNTYVGMKGVSLWSFVVGGNLLGVILGVMMYPVLKRVFARLRLEDYGAARPVYDDTVSQVYKDTMVQELPIRANADASRRSPHRGEDG